MADTQDKAPKGFVGTLKAALSRIGGRRPTGAGAPTPAAQKPATPTATKASAPAQAADVPEPAALQTSVDEAPIAAPAEVTPEPQTAAEIEPALAAAAGAAVDAAVEPEDVPVVGAEAVPAAQVDAADSPFLEPVGDDTRDSDPDGTWTVARLRTLARERGVRGYSAMSKAQLLAALTGPQA